MRLSFGIAAVAAVAVCFGVASADAVTSKKLVAVQVDEYSVFPATQGAPVGKVRFVVTNVGTIEHEFVVIKTVKPAGNLLKGRRGERDRRRRRARWREAWQCEGSRPQPEARALRAPLQPARPLQDGAVRRLLRALERSRKPTGLPPAHSGVLDEMRRGAWACRSELPRAGSDPESQSWAKRVSARCAAARSGSSLRRPLDRGRPPRGRLSRGSPGGREGRR